MYDYSFTLPPGVRLGKFARMIDAFERDEIEAAVDMLIERLDARDGDVDLEDDDPAATDLDKGEGGSWIECSERSPGPGSGGDCEDDEPDARQIRIPFQRKARRRLTAARAAAR